MNLLQEIQELINDIEEAFADAYRAVSDVISKVPDWLGWLRDAIADAWNDACQKIQEFWTYLDEGELGYPDVLSSTAARWTSDVGGPASALVGVAEASNLDADNAWQGDAAEAYRDRLSLHKNALAAVKNTLTNGLANALDKVQAGLQKYYTSFIAALVSLSVGIVAGILAIASVIGAPAAIGTLIAGIGAAISAIAVGRALLQADCRSAKTAIELVISDSTAFGGDHWPAGAVS